MLTPVSIARSGFIASGQVGWPHVASGAVRSGDVGDAAIVSGDIASGQIAHPHFGSGAILSGDIASGQVGRFHLSSGAVSSGRIVSGAINSGQIGVGSPDGTKFLRDDLTWQTAGTTLTSGVVGSGILASGSVQGFFGTTRDIASGTVGVFDFGSGAVVAGTVGSGAVVSGNVASGQLGAYHFTSGLAASMTAPMQSGLGQIIITEEIISGVRAVQLSQSGNLRIAMASVSGRMPAIGVVVDNVLSGIEVNVFDLGTFQLSSGMVDFSGYLGLPLFVGRSGQIVTLSGSFNSGGLLSGDIYQVVGVPVNSGEVLFEARAALPFVPTLIYSGDIASGQVGQFHLSSGSVQGLVGGFQVASGTFNGFELGSGAIVSGRVASGQLGAFHMASGYLGSGFWIQSGGVWGRAGPNQFMIASGTIATFDIASGGVVSGNIASGQLGQFHYSSGSIQGLVGGFQVASGTFNGFELGSGAIVSGRIASGQVGNFHVASGQVQGLAGAGVPNVASGTLNGFELGSGAVVSGRIASGQIGRFHLGSGAITSGVVVSGAINSGQIGFGTPDTTTFLRGDFQWTSPGAASVTSGAIGQDKIASGLMVKDVATLVSGYNPLTSGMAEEAISGVRAVCISQSGNIRIAMASVSGRMPAIGVVFDNVASGIQVNVHQFGTFVPTSGMIETSGYGAQLLYVGRSGQVVTASGSYNSGGLLSGDISQPLGLVVQDFSGVGNPKVVMIAAAAMLPFVAGQIASGNVASGQLSTYHLASGALAMHANEVVPLFSGGVWTVITSERISGIRAVCVDKSMSGLSVCVAMASVSGRMPAIGVVYDNVASGIQCNVHAHGICIVSSGLIASGVGNYVGRTLWVGRSGQIAQMSGGWNSGGWLSGDIGQSVGHFVTVNSGNTSGQFMINVDSSYWSGGPNPQGAGGMF